MPSPYYSRDPDQRAADQGAACLIVLLLFVILAPLTLLIRSVNVQRRYMPKALDVPARIWRGRKYADYEAIDWMVVVVILIAFLFAFATPNPRDTYVLLISAGVVGVGWEVYRQYQPRKKVVSTLPRDAQSMARALGKSCTYIIYPAKTDPDFVTGEKLVQALLSTMPDLSFQIVAEASGITWQVVDPFGRYESKAVEDTLKSYLGRDAQIERSVGVPDNTRRMPFFREHLHFELANEFAAPLPFLEMLKAYDPLTAVTQRMSLLDAEQHERIIYQLWVTVATDTARTVGARRIEQNKVRTLPGVPRDKNEEKTGLNERFIKEKLASTLYHCFLGVTLESRSRDRLTQLRQVAQDIAHFAVPAHNALKLHKSQTRAPREIASADADAPSRMDTSLVLMAQSRQAWQKLLLVLSPREIAALWHLPNEEFTAPNIAWAGTPVPPELTGERGERVCLGSALALGRSIPVYLAPSDRAYHHYVTGKTGMGKSTLLHNLIDQDIAAGRGVLVIDPHGKLVDDILASSIPKQRVKDVLLLECGQAAYPVPLNPFRIPSGVSFTTAFNYLYWVLSKIYESVWRPGRMDLVFRNLLHALLCDPGATPLDIERLFTDSGYRTFIVGKIGEHPEGSTAVQNYWRTFGHKARSDQAEIASPILSRTGIFLGNRTIEQMTCHPHALNFQAAVAQQKIVLVNLAGEAIRSEVGSLGAMFLAGFYMASEALGYIPDQAPPRAYLYVDEVERIIANPLPDMYAQARKCGLSLTLANQYLDQLSDDVVSGILGNVGTKLIFECGDNDARRLAHQLEPEITRQALQNLGAYQMAVKTRFAGKTLPPFFLRTAPPPPRHAGADADLEALRTQLAKMNGFLSGKQVREWLQGRYRVEASANGHKQDTPADVFGNVTDYE